MKRSLFGFQKWAASAAHFFEVLAGGGRPWLTCLHQG
jgi:hypothetical protein